MLPRGVRYLLLLLLLLLLTFSFCFLLCIKDAIVSISRVNTEAVFVHNKRFVRQIVIAWQMTLSVFRRFFIKEEWNQRKKRHVLPPSLPLMHFSFAFTWIVPCRWCAVRIFGNCCFTWCESKLHYVSYIDSIDVSCCGEWQNTQTDSVFGGFSTFSRISHSAFCRWDGKWPENFYLFDILSNCHLPCVWFSFVSEKTILNENLLKLCSVLLCPVVVKPFEFVQFVYLFTRHMLSIWMHYGCVLAWQNE